MPSRAPGVLRAGVDPDVLMMICTAGHVDHGKTRLVRLLTGCNTDRLKEEQERGLTIELGFAPCFLGGNLACGIVDVPGHEKFVKNMVAGVSGIDLAVLVVAADDGIMPQTVEHVQIMELLGVPRGIVAITKIDLVAPERVAELTDEVRAFLAGTFLADAPICPVSSETGDGIFAFYDVLVARIQAVERRARAGVFRMPVERVFVQKGFGTVITGIPTAGAVSVGMAVESVPGGERGRVRGIQRFLRNAQEGGHGQCLAMNIPDLTKRPPERGDVLCEPGYLQPRQCFLVRVRPVPGLEHPLRNAEQIKFHTGTKEAAARFYFVDGDDSQDAPEKDGVVLTAEPVAAALHDRFIVRRASPAITVAGGEIAEARAEQVRPKKEVARQRLAAYRQFFDGVERATAEFERRTVLYVLAEDLATGAAAKQIGVAALLPDATVRERLAELVARGDVVAVTPEHFVYAPAYAQHLAALGKRIANATASGALSLPLTELRKGLEWPAPLWDRAVQDLCAKGEMTVRGGKAVLRSAVASMPARDSQLAEAIMDVYERTRFQSPRPDELPELVKARPSEVERLVEYLCSEGRLVRLAKNVLLSYNAFTDAQRKVVELIQSEGVLDSAEFKLQIGSSRKYALAILDFLDARHVTVRNDNERRLAPNYESRLL